MTARQDMSNAPVIILVDPQMGENIGAAARAMLNCGLDKLRIVRPRDGWPNERADAMSAGALAAMPPVEVYDSTEAAIADCHYVVATTARMRDMDKEVITPRQAGIELSARAHIGEKTAILFGAERSGLTNDDTALANAIVTIPLNPNFSSLNLGQAVLLLAYEFAQNIDDTPAIQRTGNDTEIASNEAVMNLCQRLEVEMDKGGFFRAPDLRPTIVRNIKNMFGRAGMTEQEVKTFHGIITALINR
jgi:tRNA/rRNA methyltransferase